MKTISLLNPVRLIKITGFILAAVAMVSCQKEINPLEEDGNPSGGGGSNTTPATGSYMPHSKGSFWTYQDSAVSSLTYTIVATDTKKTVNGITYYRYDVTEGVNTQDDLYYGQQGSDYYLLISKDELGLSADLNMLYLKDNASVGTTWTKDAGSVQGIAARISGKILAKGYNHDWTGILFKDILQTKVDLEYNMLGSWISVASYNFYNVKGIGQVKSHNSVEAFGQDVFSNAVYLVDYEIK